jgi:excisionase family DNA binding protein
MDRDVLQKMPSGQYFNLLGRRLGNRREHTFIGTQLHANFCNRLVHGRTFLIQDIQNCTYSYYPTVPPTAAARNKRGMTCKEAAELYGLPLSTFYKARREGRIPGPTLPGRRYDRRLLEINMDKQSGICQVASLSPLEEWRKRCGPN